MTTRQPFWKWRRWKTKCNYPRPQAHEIWNWNSKANLSYAPETMPPTEYTNEKSNMAARQPFWKWLSLKINRLLPIYTSILLLKLGVDTQSQTEVRVRKPKNPIWPPGGHFETDVAEKQWAFLPMATINMHMKFEVEIPKQTLKTMLSTDRQTDRQTRWMQYTYPHPT